MSSAPTFSNEAIFFLDEDVTRAPSRGRPFIIGVCGGILLDIEVVLTFAGTASGKTTVCEKIVEELKTTRAAIISQDCFYRPLTVAQKEKAASSEFNFDHPGNASVFARLLTLG